MAETDVVALAVLPLATVRFDASSSAFWEVWAVGSGGEGAGGLTLVLGATMGAGLGVVTVAVVFTSDSAFLQ